MMSNLVTAIGVLLVLAAVAALTGNVWWAVLLAGLVLCAAGYVSRPTSTDVSATAPAKLQAVRPEKAAA
jgi:predicted cobalt transporter CbtA